METKICKNCNQEFETRNSIKVFCSPRCRYESMKRKYLERYHSRRESPPTRCVQCGGDLPTKHRSRKYCSSECRNRAGIESKRAEKHEIPCAECGRIFLGDSRYKYCDGCKQSVKYRDSIRVAAQRNRARQAGLPANFGTRDWKAVKRRFGNRCAYCGAGGELHQDHFIPHALGGGYVKGNIVPACPKCNDAKNGTHPAEWLTPEKYSEVMRIARA